VEVIVVLWGNRKIPIQVVKRKRKEKRRGNTGCKCKAIVSAFSLPAHVLLGVNWRRERECEVLWLLASSFPLGPATFHSLSSRLIVRKKTLLKRLQRSSNSTILPASSWSLSQGGWILVMLEEMPLVVPALRVEWGAKGLPREDKGGIDFSGGWVMIKRALMKREGD